MYKFLFPRKLGKQLTPLIFWGPAVKLMKAEVSKAKRACLLFSAPTTPRAKNIPAGVCRHVCFQPTKAMVLKWRGHIWAPLCGTLLASTLIPCPLSHTSISPLMTYWTPFVKFHRYLRSDKMGGRGVMPSSCWREAGGLPLPWVKQSLTWGNRGFI